MKFNRNTFQGALGLIALASLAACGSSRTDTAATTVTGAVELVAAGVNAAGDGMGATTLAISNRMLKRSMPSILNFHPMTEPALTSALCNAHGIPVGYNNGDPEYPYIKTYCGMTVKDGDTVRGGFDLARSLVCSLEKGGIAFAGATQTITPDFSDTVCWPDGGPGGNDNTAGIVLEAVGSAPASFNAYFAKGVAFTVPVIGLSFKIAANLDGENIEFIASEDWSLENAGSSLGNKGWMSGSFNKTTGALKFEKRDERIRDTCSNNSCGWARHTRIAANLAVTNGSPTGLTSLSFAIADVGTLDSNGNDSFYRSLVTANGAIATGIRAQVYQDSGSDAAIKSTTYTATTNSLCVVAGDLTSTCTGAADNLTDPSGASGLKFFGYPIVGASGSTHGYSGGGTYTSTEDSLANFGGFNFTTVDISQDPAYTAN